MHTPHHWSGTGGKSYFREGTAVVNDSADGVRDGWQCPDFKTHRGKGARVVPTRSISRLAQPLRIGDNPRSGQIRTLADG